MGGNELLDFSSYMEIALYLFEYMVLYYIFSQVFEQRNKIHYLNYVYIAVLISVNLFIDNFAGLISGPAMFIKMMLVFLTFVAIYKGKILHLALMSIICFIAMGLSDYIAIIGITSLLGLDNFDFILESHNRLVFAITSKLLFLISSHIVMSRFKDVKVMDPRKLYRIIFVLMINIAFIVLAGDIYFQRKSVLTSDIYFMIGILIGITAITVIVVKMTESMINYSIKERDWQLQEDEYRRQIFYLNHLEGINHQMKSIRHDFNHHISCLHGMLEQGKHESAKVYANELVYDAEQFNVAFSSEYPGISGLLSSKYQTMRSQNIEFVWSVDLPTNMSIKLIDLSIVLGNSIDNAIEAVSKLNDNERLIELGIYSEIEYLVIKIKNKYLADSISSRLLTTKEDEENHGYGLNNIKFIVNKYDGIIKINTDENVFSVNIALPYEELK